MSPPEEPPDAGLPEGISLETTSGVSVLRVSFDGDGSARGATSRSRRGWPRSGTSGR